MWPFLEGADGCGCGCQIVACPEGLPQKRVLPGAEPESFSHQLLSVEPQPEQEPQKPHLLEEQGENLGFRGTDAGALTYAVSVQRSFSGWGGRGLEWRPGQLPGWPGAGRQLRTASVRDVQKSLTKGFESFCSSFPPLPHRFCCPNAHVDRPLHFRTALLAVQPSISKPDFKLCFPGPLEHLFLLFLLPSLLSSLSPSCIKYIKEVKQAQGVPWGSGG